MARVERFELLAVELPFRKPFSHAAAVRHTSSSLLLKCVTGTGRVGFGECLPRDYVSGETRDGVFELLSGVVLPRLAGREFPSWEHLWGFLGECNGEAPAGWVDSGQPQTAAWAAVDLALLDAFGREFGRPVVVGENRALPRDFRYSVVFSAAPGLKFLKTALLVRLLGFRQVKLKVDRDGSEPLVRTARRVLGPRCAIRADANMAWTVDEALEVMPRLARWGVRCFEQPVAADDLDGLARLVRETGLEVMVDESLTDGASLEAVIARGACTAVNVRISKCGGLAAAYARCRRALEAGLVVQVGCQVGETSLLSAAQLRLIAGVGSVTYGEGCFGRHLLREDPVAPPLQFGRAGRPPAVPAGDGLGVAVDEGRLDPFVVRRASVP